MNANTIHVNRQLRRPQAGGFSLAELVVALIVLAAIAAIGFQAATNVQKDTKRTKLEQDVYAINRAASVYMASGGRLDSVSRCDEVLTRLKTTAAAAQTRQIPGIKGQMVDTRISGIMQSESEAATSEPRAVWVPAERRFQIRTNGDPGVKEFVLNMPAGAAAEETRAVSLKFAEESNWIWDYSEGTGFARPAYSDTVTTSGNLEPPSVPQYGYQPLAPPDFSIAPGSYALINYDLPLNLTNPNPSGVAQTYYSVDGGSMQLYTSQILVPPWATISAYSKSIYPDLYMDSGARQDLYQTTPVKLAVLFTVPTLSVTYAEVGGVMLPGIYPPVGPLPSGSATLSNAGAIPAKYQSDSVFTVRRTYDGSDPLSSGTAVAGGSFSNGFPGQAVEFLLNRWGGSQSTLPIAVAAKSLKTSLVLNSAVVTQTLSIKKSALRAPVVAEVVPAGPQIKIDPVTSYADMPDGYQIYYTVDGTDPGDNGAGRPVGGILYTAPITQPRLMCSAFGIKARVYGPPGRANWFTPSPVSTLTRPSLASTSDSYAFVCDFIQSQLCQYTWLTLGNGAETSISGGGPVITGKMGVGPGATFTVSNGNAGPSSIVRDPTASVNSPGTPQVVQNLSAYQAAAFALNQAAAALTPTQTLGTIKTTTVITRTGEMNVISVNQIQLGGNGTSLTIQGNPDDYFIVNVKNDFDVTGGGIILIDGPAASRVIFNAVPGISTVRLAGGAMSLGASILSPAVKVTLSGGSRILGSVYSGSGSAMSGGSSLVGSSAFGGCDNCCQ